MKNILIHIPHSSYIIPKKYKELFFLNEDELHIEQLKMTDSYTNELFDIKGIQKLIFRISRLICDVERFRNENDEEMTRQGMWVCYTKTSDGKPLKKADNNHRKEILEKYYDKHHLLFENQVKEMLKKYNRCLIIDAHSFSSNPLPYELHSDGFRPDICIGADDFHTPDKIINYFSEGFTKLGYKVKINNPFCGTIVPLRFYNRERGVNSVMIEINRSLYMDEVTGRKNKNFLKVKQDISQVINNVQFCHIHSLLYM